MTLDNFQVCEQDLSTEILDQYLQAYALAIDTETMGLNPDRDRLCLVQVSSGEGVCHIVSFPKDTWTKGTPKHLDAHRF